MASIDTEIVLLPALPSIPQDGPMRSTARKENQCPQPWVKPKESETATTSCLRAKHREAPIKKNRARP
jgi:hypothetical protein